MWNRKDLVLMTLAATATFALTCAILITPNVLAAPDDSLTKTIQSPVLKIGDCEIRAEVVKGALPGKDATPGGPGEVHFVASREILPVIKLTVTNLTNKPATVTFHAVMVGATALNVVSRVPRPVPPAWSNDYNLSLKPGETKEIEADTKVQMTTGTSQLQLSQIQTAQVQTAENAPSDAAVRTLTFSVRH